jgi:hypothetical protein
MATRVPARRRIEETHGLSFSRGARDLGALRGARPVISGAARRCGGTLVRGKGGAILTFGASRLALALPRLWRDGAILAFGGSRLAFTRLEFSWSRIALALSRLWQLGHRRSGPTRDDRGQEKEGGKKEEAAVAPAPSQAATFFSSRVHVPAAVALHGGPPHFRHRDPKRRRATQKSAHTNGPSEPKLHRRRLRREASTFPRKNLGFDSTRICPMRRHSHDEAKSR